MLVICHLSTITVNNFLLSWCSTSSSLNCSRCWLNISLIFCSTSYGSIYCVISSTCFSRSTRNSLLLISNSCLICLNSILSIVNCLNTWINNSLLRINLLLCSINPLLCSLLWCLWINIDIVTINILLRSISLRGYCRGPKKCSTCDSHSTD